MATNQVHVKQGTQIRFFVTGSFSPADAGTNYTVGSPTDVVLTLSGLAHTAGRQSTKVDLGATRAPEYSVFGCVDFTGETPTVNTTVDYYWLPSASATAGTGNIAGNSGVDAAAPGGALGSITLTEFKRLGQFIGQLRIHDGASVQNGYVGTFSPRERYGQLLVINESGDAFEADDVEMHQVMNPIFPDIQAAA
jgi:hypothetical protein